MSAKKKSQVFTECKACKWLILTKDVPDHIKLCGTSIADSPISLLIPKTAIKGYITEIDRVIEYIPPDSVGWTRNYSVLLNPQTMEHLEIKPRSPVRITDNEGRTVIMIAWPCKEIGALKMAPSSKCFNADSFCLLEVVHDFTLCDRLEITIIDTGLPLESSMVDYIESYLTNCFLEPDVPLSINYYGSLMKVMASSPLELKLHDISLNEGESYNAVTYYVKIVSTVLRTSSNLSVFLSNVPVNDKFEKTYDFNSVGGLHSVKSVLREHLLDPFTSGGVCSSVLMWGLPGSGKSEVLKALCNALGKSSFYFESMTAFGERSCLISKGSIVILDLKMLEKEHKDYPVFIDFLKSSKAASVVLSVCDQDEVDLGVRVRFPVEVEVEVPNERERLEILNNLLETSVAKECTETLARRTHGFTAGDLKSLVVRARNTKGKSNEEKLEGARKLIRPTGIRQLILEIPDVKWEDIGGNEDLKSEIQRSVIWPQTHKEAYKHYGSTPPTGILLYGPPGCSKTLIARALANEAKMNFLSVKGPELFSKWVGDSEKAVRDLFARARQVAPTIVFFDEIDAVGGSRGSDTSTGVSDRVLTQLLTELDGLEKNSGVILLAATNRPDQLDSALLRPGRLDRSIHVGLPTPSTRKQILEIRMRKMPIANDVALDNLVDNTEGYSGAELVAVCQHAALVAMKRDLVGEVCSSDFQTALEKIPPRTDRELLDIYHQFELGCVSK